ncbi:MAG: polysaccharide pyruvyl transferase family protein [Candidatus Krumholzibacteria bacterium]|nr:polysaccharide pyruvyl transferase family protein [Candidatus Krumholzibacteria bacterium]
MARRLVADARRFAEQPRRHRHALVLPAAGPGSLGDEAMLVAAGDVLSRFGIDKLTVVSYGPDEDWSPLGAFNSIVPFGHRYQTDFWTTCRELMMHFRDATHFLVLGADVMDGFYNPYEAVRRVIYTRIAAAAGLQTAIGSFSFNDAPHPRSVAALKSLDPTTALIARDPVSQQRLQDRIAHPVALGADIAFLLEPAAATPIVAALRAWLATVRSEGRQLVGINANYLVAPDHRREDRGEDMVAAYAAGLTGFLRTRRNVYLVLIPHDYRRMAGRYDDLQLLQMIAAQLPAEFAPRVRVIDQSLRAAEAKAIAAELDLVVSGRMHLAIAALGAGVPAAGITYQGKFEGLWKHFGLNGASLDPERLFAQGALESFLRDCIDQRDSWRTILRKRLPHINSLALVNFNQLCQDTQGTS